MKPFVNILLAAVTTLTLASALAAPQDAAIAEAKKVQAGEPAVTSVAAPAATEVAKKYPLDHGPRAEVTPWVNEQRRLHDQHAQQLAAHSASDQRAGTNESRTQ